MGTLSERRDLEIKSSLFSCLGTMGGRLCREVSVPWLSTWSRCNTRGLTTFFRGVLEKKMLKMGRRQCRVGGMNTRLSWAGCSTLVLGRPKDSNLINYLVGGGRDITLLSTWKGYREGCSTLALGRSRGSSLISYLVGGKRDDGGCF